MALPMQCSMSACFLLLCSNLQGEWKSTRKLKFSEVAKNGFKKEQNLIDGGFQYYQLYWRKIFIYAIME